MGTFRHLGSFSDARVRGAGVFLTGRSPESAGRVFGGPVAARDHRGEHPRPGDDPSHDRSHARRGRRAVARGSERRSDVPPREDAPRRQRDARGVHLACAIGSRRFASARVALRPPRPRRRAATAASSIVPVGTQFDVRLQGQLNSGTATVEQRFEATTLVDYSEGTRIVIPAGSLVRGFVSSVRAAGRIDRRGSLTLSFDELRVGNRTYRLRAAVTEALDGKMGEDMKRVGAASVVGAIIGGLFGGTRGALDRHPGRRRRYDCRDRGQRRRFADRHHSAHPDRPATGDCGRTAVMTARTRVARRERRLVGRLAAGLAGPRGATACCSASPSCPTRPVSFASSAFRRSASTLPPPPAAVDGIERMIAKGIERRQAGQVFSFAIQLADSGELAGILQFVSSRDHVSDAAIPAVWELGFALSARYWGAGLLGEAAAMALGFAFGRVGLDAVEAWVIAENRRANRALEKLGGVAVFKPNTQAPDGRIADFVLLDASGHRTASVLTGSTIGPAADQCLAAGASGTALSVTVRGCRRLR